MILELFGLSRSGKTTLKEDLISLGLPTVPDTNKFIKFYYFMIQTFKHPINTICLFYKSNTNYLPLKKFSLKGYFKMIVMKNSYLIGALAKYEQAKKIINPYEPMVVIDEGTMQSLLMILQKKSTIKQVQSLIYSLPKPDLIYFVEADKKERYERIKKTRFPAQCIELEYAKNWMTNSEHNYKLIKQELQNQNVYIV